MQRDPQFLLDMLQSAELVARYTANCSKAQFLDDIQLQDSVIRRLLVLAEAAKRTPVETLEQFPGIAWREINGMRNRLVHEYDDIDLDIVWDVVQTEIPILIRDLKPRIPPDV